MIVFSFIIGVFIGSIINIIIFLIGLRILDKLGEGGLWVDPKQTVIQALWFVPSITLVTTLLRFLPILGWVLGLVVWIIALRLVYSMRWYEMFILSLLFSFARVLVFLLSR